MSNSHVLASRHMPVGAELIAGAEGTHFRVWAPGHKSVRVVFKDSGEYVELAGEEEGFYSGTAPGVGAGARYKYQLDGGDAYPDPAARFQPDGPHGFSQAVDPAAFVWSDEDWKGLRLAGQVIYEMHVGAFTGQGSWCAAALKLGYLRDTGITAIEVMPAAEFAGRFGWGYDGVQPYAPTRLYGTPDDMRRFVDQAHRHGLGVILDVVYNHVGPDGNYLPEFSPFYFSKKDTTDWGEGINFDGQHCGPVREYFRENAAYWIREFHLDGLRLDATQDIHDDSRPHIIAEIAEAARSAAGGKPIIIVGENEPQDTLLIRRIEDGGYGLDALWNDDFHHTANVALTGKADAYYSDYRGTPQELVATLKHGYLYQGQYYKWQRKRRGTSTFGIPRSSLINFIQNHDQVANSARGERLQQLSAPGMFKAITAVMLLGPATPMLFQGEEFGASTPFLFFADHKPEIAKKVRKGRREFLEQWRSLQAEGMSAGLADPCSEETFERSKLDFSELERNYSTYRLHVDLLRLRREDPVISRQGADGIDGAVLSSSAFVARFFSPDFQEDRLLVVNLGIELRLNPAPEPLLAPPSGTSWRKLWSSEDPDYGGCGTAPLDTQENWIIPGQAAVVLYPAADKQNSDPGEQRT